MQKAAIEGTDCPFSYVQVYMLWTIGMTGSMCMNAMLPEVSMCPHYMVGGYGPQQQLRGVFYDGEGYTSGHQKSPAKPSLRFREYSHSDILLLRDLYLHARFDLRAAEPVESHDVLCAYSRVVLGNAVE